MMIFKKVLIAGLTAGTMMLSSNPVFSMNYWVDADNETESFNKGMQRCKNQAKKPELCRVAKVQRGSNGSYRVIVVAN
jgi:hypothetical protein